MIEAFQDRMVVTTSALQLRLNWQEDLKQDWLARTTNGKRKLLLQSTSSSSSDMLQRLDKFPVDEAKVIKQDKDQVVLRLQGKYGPHNIAIEFTLFMERKWVHIKITDYVEDLVDIEWLEAAYHFCSNQKVDFVWTPALRPEADDVIGQHFFRSPAVILQAKRDFAALIPDLDFIKENSPLPACLNLDRFNQDIQPEMRYGLRPHILKGHVYFQHTPAMTASIKNTTLQFGYYLYLDTDAPPQAGYQKVVYFLWDHYKKQYINNLLPQTQPFDAYAEQIYSFANKTLWRETMIDNERCGAMVLSRQCPDDVWFQGWFNQLRSAYGLHYFGTRMNNSDWVKRAEATQHLILHAPQDKGLFPTIFVLGDSPDQNRWVNSNLQGGGPDLFHPLDCSWTAYWLLKWYQDLRWDARTLPFCRHYADALLKLQLENGAIPDWVKADTLEPIEKYNGEKYADTTFDYIQHMLSRWDTRRFIHSAESAASGLFLAELVKVLGNQDARHEKYLSSAIRIANYLQTYVLPQQKWFDFETFFSCSVKPLDFYDRYTRQYPQNTLVMHWTAAFLLTLYEVTHNKNWLSLGKRVQDYLNLYQQVWNPPFLSIYGFGGFGVMNTDGEWNDARQSQFGCTQADYFLATDGPEYLERAIYAVRAAFTCAFLPANKKVYPTGYRRKPQGQAAENHGHGGHEMLCGVSGFDWGTGSALTGAAYLLHRLGGAYVDIDKACGFGIDGCFIRNVKTTADTVSLKIVTPFELLSRIIVKFRGSKKKEYVIIVNDQSLGRFNFVQLTTGISCPVRIGS